LLEDFGQTVFSKVLSEENEEQLYRTAIEIIDYLHRNYNANANKKNGIFDYSEIELVKEARLFVDWYLKEHKQISLKEKSIIEFEIIIANIFKDVAPCRESIVLRDYHVDNLFFLQNRNGLQSVGLIDFQDALAGSPVYDLASLIEDVRRPLNRDLKDRLLDYFINLSDLSENQIRNEMAFFSVQRNLKILGIFCRLKYRDKKDSYMRLIPNGISFIQNHLNNDNMDDLNKWFKRNNVDLGPSN
jgi:aminoglycoside/choline kinase family phosphotransferase